MSILRDKIHWKIGNSQTISLWYDSWLLPFPLIYHPDICNMELVSNKYVADILNKHTGVGRGEANSKFASQICGAS